MQRAGSPANLYMPRNIDLNQIVGAALTYPLPPLAGNVRGQTQGLDDFVCLTLELTSQLSALRAQVTEHNN